MLLYTLRENFVLYRVDRDSRQSLCLITDADASFEVLQLFGYANYIATNLYIILDIAEFICR